MLQPTVQPKILRKLMEDKKFTCSDVASQSGVATKTISRLLNPTGGRGKRPRRQTVESIARALGTTPEKLFGKAERDPQPKRDLAADGSELLTQLNVRVDHATRNAMALICRHYGVKAHQLVMLAPLLFHCVAERSLARRRSRLNELEAKQAEAEALRHNFEHLHACLWANTNADEISFAEQDSINKSNIFGDDILTIEGLTGPASDEFYTDESRINPFSKFVSDFVVESTSRIKFDGFERSSIFSCYTLDREFVLDAVNGDPEVANAIVNGVVGLHEVPTELRDRIERLQWLKKTSEDRAAAAADLWSNWQDIIEDKCIPGKEAEK